MNFSGKLSSGRSKFCLSKFYNFGTSYTSTEKDVQDLRTTDFFINSKNEL
jgi:hypothetical protein